LCFECIASQVIESGICDPYFVSIKASEANLHVGPGKEYKTSLKYIVSKIPIMVIAKYDHWRKIQDIDGTTGWIHKSLLSNERYVMVNSDTCILYANSSTNSKRIAYIKKNVPAKLLDIKDKWCKIKLNHNNSNYIGWTQKNLVFGVFKNEK
jgi:SH3-like domain-containing protein